MKDRAAREQQLVTILAGGQIGQPRETRSTLKALRNKLKEKAQ
jgi:hypothetical protein